MANKISSRLKEYFALRWATIGLLFLFHYAIINQILYLFTQSANPRFWPWVTGVLELPDIFVSHPPFIAWLFFVCVGLGLFTIGLFSGDERDFHQSMRLRGFRWVGLAIMWQMLMFSVPIDVLKFLHSFNF